jgi:hypothetical protein
MKCLLYAWLLCLPFVLGCGGLLIEPKETATSTETQEQPNTSSPELPAN